MKNHSRQKEKNRSDNDFYLFNIFVAFRSFDMEEL